MSERICEFCPRPVQSGPFVTHTGRLFYSHECRLDFTRSSSWPLGGLTSVAELPDRPGGPLVSPALWRWSYIARRVGGSVPIAPVPVRPDISITDTPWRRLPSERRGLRTTLASGGDSEGPPPPPSTPPPPLPRRRHPLIATGSRKNHSSIIGRPSQRRRRRRCSGRELQRVGPGLPGISRELGTLRHRTSRNQPSRFQHLSRQSQRQDRVLPTSARSLSVRSVRPEHLRRQRPSESLHLNGSGQTYCNIIDSSVWERAWIGLTESQSRFGGSVFLPRSGAVNPHRQH